MAVPDKMNLAGNDMQKNINITVMYEHQQENGGKHFLPNTCLAQTNGLKSATGHDELQMVVLLDPATITGMMNCIITMIVQGVQIGPGVRVGGILQDQDIRFVNVDYKGQQYCRLVIPDSNNRWPDDELCEVPYRYQILPVEQIWYQA